MKRWCIINLQWLGAGDEIGRPNGDCLPERYRPSIFYNDRAVAEAELFRLKKKYPGDFHLFESVGKIVPSPVAPGAFHLTGDI
jgi:hypothetical protein